MNLRLHTAGSGAARFAGLAMDALRGMRWPQLRAAMLFDLVVGSWNASVFLPTGMQFARTGALLPGLALDVIPYQIKAACLLVAVLIADRAVDEGAPRRVAYAHAALIGCVVGVLVSPSVGSRAIG